MVVKQTETTSEATKDAQRKFTLTKQKKPTNKYTKI